MGRRPILAAVGWLATTVAATLIGLGAIRLVGEGILTGTPGGVRDQREVERALAAPAPSTRTATPGATPTATAPSPTPSAGHPGGGGRQVFTTSGGTAVAECGPVGVRLVSWSPAPGYQVKDSDRGPDDHVEVRFVGPEGEHELRLRCVGGRPVAVPHD
ncbi:septum formation initiator [Micromonospora soli]|uniref:septum formation initiator n=1 Tax=Micromonospora sp. NBRC 110009 TaxID=3061627 RepID=UPI0026735BB4|nr:septum formation initiator [Micromonospora sp. NBRC 110009]WKT99827.1 septum formation initiator [Micromonospora sp. NBRC 110009]